jgi:bifunctional non-homologous end joining protein LigD
MRAKPIDRLRDACNDGKPHAASVTTPTSSTKIRSVPSRTRASKAPSSAVEIAGVTISHPDKLMFPECGVTKKDLAEYYAFIAPRILPHVEKRPLSMVRCPDGWSGTCFFQKHADKSVNAAVDRLEVPESKGTATYMAASSAKALVALVQWGVLELHPWGSKRPRLDRPDQLILDLDPADGVEWPVLKEAVLLVRKLVDGLELSGFLKTTGGKGLHVVVPIRPTLSWEQAKGLTHAIAEFLVRGFPDRFVATADKDARRGKIFIDYLRNAQGATAVAPYSVRARKNAPIAMPVGWDELRRDIRFDRFNVRNIRNRLARGSDPWADFAVTRQQVSAAMACRVDYDLGPISRQRASAGPA